MESHNHNSNSDTRSTTFRPGEIVCLDGYYWQCYCHDLPSADWESDEKKMVACEICEDIYGHVEGEKLLDLLYKDKKFPPYLILFHNTKKRHTKAMYHLF